MQNKFHPLSSECSILLVEDEEAPRVAIEKLLKHNFKQVYTAQDGKEGIKRAIANKDEIDIIVSDISMSELNGIGMLQELKRGGVEIPTILISAYGDKENLQKAIDVDVSSFIQKPFEYDTFICEVNKILEHKEKSNRIEKTRMMEFLKTLEIPFVALDSKGAVINYNKQFESLFHPFVDKIALFKLHQGTLKLSNILEFHGRESLFDEQHWHRIVDSDKEGVEFGVNILLANTHTNDASYSMHIKSMEMQTDDYYLVYFLKKAQNNVTHIEKSVVLVIDESPLFRKLVKKELNGIDCNIIECDDVSRWEDLIEDVSPSVIIIDFILSNANGLKEIEKLSMHPLTKHAAIVALSSVDTFAVIEKSIKAGASKFVKKPFLKHELREIVSKHVKEGVVCNKTEIRRTIEGLVNFCKSDMSAYRMLHKMLYLKSTVNEEEKSCEYYDCISNLLSVALKQHTPKQLIGFLNSIKAPAKLINSLIDTINPTSLHSKICHFVYHAEKSFVTTGRVSFDAMERRDEHLERLTRLAYSQFAYTVRSGNDAEHIWQYYFRQLSEINDVSIARISLFNELISKALIQQLIYGEGGTCRLEILDEKIMFVFEPQKIDMKNIDKLLSDLHSFEHDISIYFTSENERIRIIIELDRTKKEERPKDEPKSDEVLEFMDFSPLENSATIQDTKKRALSATDFLNEADIDPEDVQNLKSLEDDTMEFIELLDYSAEKIKLIQEIANSLRSYGTQIIYLREFQDISNALISLGVTFESADYSLISDTYMKFFPVIFSNLIHDLKKWREGIFVTQDVTNVHYLDASIIANCEQCISILKSFESQGGESSEESGDIEFF